MDNKDTRVYKIKSYLCNIINTLTNNRKNEINIDFLCKNVNNYSLDKVPTEKVVRKWIYGVEIHRDVYSFKSRKEYSINEINNLSNIGFFEQFEDAIETNNKKGILPDIDEIESIECLNPGTLISTGTNTAIFEITIQITYRKNNNKGGNVSL